MGEKKSARGREEIYSDLGMATKVQCESYLPLMRIPTEDSSSSWYSYYEDKTLKEHFYPSFTLRPASENSGYDKEMLKRTVLEHEAIFRKQVCELHRLYRTQKDLMDELKRKELYKLPVQGGISQPFLFSLAMETETTENIWGLPLFNKSVVASDADIKPSFEALKGKYLQFSQIPSKTGVSLNNDEFSNSKPEGCPKQMLDLQLPADVYIDDGDFGGIQKDDIFNPFCRVRDNSSIMCDIEHENDVKLTLGTRGGCSSGSWNPYPIGQNSPSKQSLDHMNGFKKGLSHEGQSGSASNHFLYGDQLPMGSSRNFMPTDFSRDKHRDDGPCLNFFDADEGKARQQVSSFNYGDGISRNGASSFNLGLSGEKCLMLSETLERKRKSAHNIPSHGRGEMQTWFEEKPTLGIESYQKGSPFVVDPDNSITTNSHVPGPLSIIPSSPIASSGRKPPKIITHIPIAVQALPCFPASEMTKAWSRKPKGSIQNTTVQNGSLQDIWFNFNSTKQVKNDSDSSIYEKPESYASQECPESEKDTREDENFEKLSKGCSKSFNQSQGHTPAESTPNILGFPICTPSANDIEFKLKSGICEVGKVTEKRINIDLNTLEISAENEDADLDIPVHSYETVDTLAADNLVLMSQELTHQLPLASCDSLHWFADVILSEMANPDYADNNEMDLFETLTRKLEEMKPDEYLPPRQEHESKKDENYSGIKPCKGRARKRQQKKDFQKDILPGLVALSRHQMTEDLHAFDCLMRAMGESWESKFTRRTTSRKGAQSSPPTHATATAHSKVEIDGKSILEWGRKTRRGRRPRVRHSNAYASLVVS